MLPNRHWVISSDMTNHEISAGSCYALQQKKKKKPSSKLGSTRSVLQRYNLTDDWPAVNLALVPLAPNKNKFQIQLVFGISYKTNALCNYYALHTTTLKLWAHFLGEVIKDLLCRTRGKKRKKNGTPESLSIHATYTDTKGPFLFHCHHKHPIINRRVTFQDATHFEVGHIHAIDS